MTTRHTSDDEPVIRPFADWLREQAGGRTHDELSDALHTLIAKVRDTGKKGTLNLVVTVAPLKDDIDVLVVSDDIKVKVPAHDRKASLFYPDADGNLTRTDPNQLSFESLRDVSQPDSDTDTITKEQQA